ncbi:MAG: DUF4241 domain-containing protein [Saprospiraceae bacterium]|nr:DUF4241 domain-containing protein [Saprospiraceae bacterium]
MRNLKKKKLIKYLPLLLISLSCINQSGTEGVKERNEVKKIDYISDYSTDTSSSDFTFPEIFQSAYINGKKYKGKHLDCSFYIYNAGRIKIESGKLIACDPIVMHESTAFKHLFPIGKFPVQLAMAKMNNDERVAFSRILFSESSIVKWEFALKPGQEPIPLADSSFYCYGVDAGTGIFIDSIANIVAAKFDQKMWDLVFIIKAEENEYKGYTYDFEGHNLATFSTGYGDGCYATYVGYDKFGNICQVLTDFGLVPWWEKE